MVKKRDKIFVLSALLMLFPLLCRSQTVFWCETFDGGGPACNNQGVGWTYGNSSGTNDANANVWIINNEATCTGSPSGGDVLHVTCDPAGPFCSIFGGPGCVYDAGQATNKVAMSPDISTVGKSNITLSFWYKCEGETGIDYGNIGISSNGGTTWLTIPVQYAATSSWTQASMPLTATYENITNFRVLFEWTNDNLGTGTDPPFMVDDIELSEPSTSPPVAAFSASNTTLCENDCINFTDSSTNSPTSWVWSFTGGTPSISNVQNPTGICYSTAGNYDVTLTATNVNGSDDTTMSSYITVNVCTGPPVAAFSASNTTLCENDCINFTDSSTNSPTSWIWSFTGGTPSISNVQNPTDICYSTAGNYDVTLTATNVNGSDTVVRTSFITVDSCAVGIIEANNDEIVKIYSNPTSKLISIYLKSQDSKNFKISLYSLLGQKIVSQEFNNTKGFQREIDLSDYPSGVYFVKIDILPTDPSSEAGRNRQVVKKIMLW